MYGKASDGMVRQTLLTSATSMHEFVDESVVWCIGYILAFPRVLQKQKIKT